MDTWKREINFPFEPTGSFMEALDRAHKYIASKHRGYYEQKELSKMLENYRVQQQV